MQADRNAVDDALLNLLNTSKYEWRKPGTKHAALWTIVAESDQPSFRQVFFVEEKTDDEAYGISRYTRHYTIYAYASVDPANEASTTETANAILTAFDNVMQSIPQGEKQTLNGLVVNAWIEGMQYISGAAESMGQQLVVEVPIKILVGT